MIRSSSKGFTLVEILVVVAIIALLAAIAIPNLLRAKISANESNAKATLKTISTALETFSLANGTYPPNVTSLLGQSPPYLTKDYFTSTQAGYDYTINLTGYTYSVVATPVNSSQGKATFTMATGGALTQNP
jgi:prepilin-type N-terminal cleavage/methylation domain-containing protein